MKGTFIRYFNLMSQSKVMSPFFFDRNMTVVTFKDDIRGDADYCYKNYELFYLQCIQSTF